jgi:hypothetical protein
LDSMLDLRRIQLLALQAVSHISLITPIWFDSNGHEVLLIFGLLQHTLTGYLP